MTPDPFPTDADGRPELLALRALKLGDLLVAVPALRGLRRAHPGHRLVLAAPAWLAPVVDLVPAVDALLPTDGLDAPLPLPPGRVDVAVNLHGRGPQSHVLLEALEPRHRIGHRAPGWAGPPWVDGMLQRARWVRLLAAYGIAADADDVGIDAPSVPSVAPGCVVVHVGAGYGSREWPVDRFAAVAWALAEAGARVVVTGGEADRHRARATVEAAGLPARHDLAGRIDLGGFAAVVAGAALVVSVDTGAAHLASAYGRPSVVLFGPATPEEWGPPAGGPHVVLTDARVRVGDVFGATPDPALLAVTADDVLAAAHRLLERGRGL